MVISTSMHLFILFFLMREFYTWWTIMLMLTWYLWIYIEVYIEIKLQKKIHRFNIKPCMWIWSLTHKTDVKKMSGYNKKGAVSELKVSVSNLEIINQSLPIGYDSFFLFYIHILHKYTFMNLRYKSNFC